MDIAPNLDASGFALLRRVHLGHHPILDWFADRPAPASVERWGGLGRSDCFAGSVNLI